MAAFGASTVTGTNKRGRAASSTPDMLTVSTAVFSFVIPANSTVAGPIDIAGVFMPPGSIILGGVVTPSATLGTTTLAFKTKTANVVFSAATAYTAEAVLTNSLPLCVPSTATANDQIQCTTAAATSPSADVTVTVSIVYAVFGTEVGRSAAVGN